MAEEGNATQAPTPKEGRGGNAGSALFQGDRRIPTISFFGYFFSALFVDGLFFWLPGAGDIFIAYCRGLYWLNGYRTVGMGWATGVDAFVEFVPGLEELPGCTVFVAWTYAINRASTKKLTEEEKRERPRFTLSERAAAAGYAYVMSKRTGAGRGGAGAPATGEAGEAGATSAKSGSEIGFAQKAGSYLLQKKVEGAKAREGTSGAPPSVDGIAPPAEARRDNVGYQPTQPVFKQGSSRDESAPKSTAYENTGYREAA